MHPLVTAAKPWVSRLNTYEAGRPIEEVARQLGIAHPEEIIKLASNENALGPSAKAITAMKDAATKMHLYPDGDSFYLREAIGRHLHVEAANVFMGHGSNEIIQLLGHIYLEKGTSVVASAQAFIVYKLVAALYEAETVEVPACGFGHDLTAMRKAIRPDTRLVFIANPNNPTGTVVDRQEVMDFVRSLPSHVVAVLDEAYVELLPVAEQPDSLALVREGQPVYVLRTFSKTYGLAGLRVGYAVAPPEGVQLLNRVRQPFNVNAMAQMAAIAALEDGAHVERTRAMVHEGLAFLCKSFEGMGLEYVPSVANFILVKTGSGREIFEALRRKKVIVRPVDGYGLPGYIRVTVGTRVENEQFIESLAEVLRERKDQG